MICEGIGFSILRRLTDCRFLIAGRLAPLRTGPAQALNRQSIAPREHYREKGGPTQTGSRRASRALPPPGSVLAPGQPETRGQEAGEDVGSADSASLYALSPLFRLPTSAPTDLHSHFRETAPILPLLDSQAHRVPMRWAGDFI